MDLKERLALLRSLRSGTRADSAMPEDVEPLQQNQERGADIEKNEDSFSEASVRRSMPADWEMLAPHVWQRILDRPAGRLPHMVQWPGTGGIDPGELVFFDLETSGLSGGAGTVAFLCGAATFVDGVLLITQYYLDDYPGERHFLEYVLDDLGKKRYWITYNGRTFDMPLLGTRCIMQGMRLMEDIRHIDILPAVRSLWKRRFGSCTLQAMEYYLYGLLREHDIPGSMVPKIWLEAVKTRQASEELQEMLHRIWNHNAQDIVSLANLFFDVADCLEHPEEAVERHAADPEGLARLLEKYDKEGDALHVLESALLVEESHSLPGARYQHALRHLARLAWRRKDWAILSAALSSMDDAIQSCIIRAKYFEHVAGDLPVALYWAEKALDCVKGEEPGRAEKGSSDDPYSLAGIERRIARLRRRIAAANQ